ncbi:MAG: 50S ribosomal protein L10 [Bacteroidia bacterium]
MTREEKAQIIEDLAEKLSQSPYFYLTDSSNLTVENINKFRRLCFQKGVEFRVVKNTLLQKAMERVDATVYEGLYGSLKGSTSIMFAEQGNVPAKLLKEFRKSFDKPVLKAAFIDSAIYTGDDQIDALVAVKSKFELIGDVIALLQSPAKNVVSALQSGGGTLAGLVKTLQERNN